MACRTLQTWTCNKNRKRSRNNRPTGSINLSAWDNHIQQIENNQFYTVTACKLKHYFGKRLATTVNTTITKAQEQDISDVEPSHKQANWVCCPEILNIYPTVYPVCNNKDCRKKISENPGSKIVPSLHCNRAMLMKNCYIKMNTAFPKIVGNSLQEDIMQYKGNIDDLTEKLLLLENVDFELSQNSKLVIGMKAHALSSQEKWTANCLVKKRTVTLNRHQWKFNKRVQFMILEWFCLGRETLFDQSKLNIRK